MSLSPSYSLGHVHSRVPGLFNLHKAWKHYRAVTHHYILALRSFSLKFSRILTGNYVVHNSARMKYRPENGSLRYRTNRGWRFYRRCHLPCSLSCSYIHSEQKNKFWVCNGKLYYYIINFVYFCVLFWSLKSRAWVQFPAKFTTQLYFFELPNAKKCKYKY